VVGHFVDVNGRKSVLYISVLGMVLISFVICLIPSFNHIGIYAAVLLLLCRMIQGLFIAGEFVTAIAYITECAAKDKKGDF